MRFVKQFIAIELLTVHMILITVLIGTLKTVLFIHTYILYIYMHIHFVPDKQDSTSGNHCQDIKRNKVSPTSCSTRNPLRQVIFLSEFAARLPLDLDVV